MPGWLKTHFSRSTVLIVEPLHSSVNVLLCKIHPQCCPDVSDAPHELLIVVRDLGNHVLLPRGHHATYLTVLEVGPQQQRLRRLDRAAALYFLLGPDGRALERPQCNDPQALERP